MAARPSLSVNDPHRRFNPLTGEWILVSPHRAQRPWQGQVDPPAVPSEVAYDPNCYLCPGNTRAGGNINPKYDGIFIFENDFAALKPDTPAWDYEEESLLVARSEAGRARVICFSPRHDLTLARMEVGDIHRVVDAWAAEFVELGSNPAINSVTVFENRGAMMGSSNPHPHGQIWANSTVPVEAVKEGATQLAWFRAHGKTLLSDYLAVELRKQERVIAANDHFVALVPFWAAWPFETMVVSRQPVSSIDALNTDQRAGLAAILSELTIRYDNIFQSSFPYTMGFHQKPTNGEAHPEIHLHAHFYPPLLRSASVKKFMVGYEMLAMPQRDITPEQAAVRLREASTRHYLHGSENHS